MRRVDERDGPRSRLVGGGLVWKSKLVHWPLLLAFGRMARRTRPDPLATKIGARIRSLRGEAGLTLEQLAYSCEFSKGQLSTIENGLAVPTASTLSVLAEGLDVLPLDLLTFPDEGPRARIVDMTRGLPPKELENLVSLLREGRKSR